MTECRRCGYEYLSISKDNIQLLRLLPLSSGYFCTVTVTVVNNIPGPKHRFLGVLDHPDVALF